MDGDRSYLQTATRRNLLHPLVAYPSLRKGHTAAMDVENLARLGPPDSDVVALVLVAFGDAAAPVGGDIHELAAAARLWTWTSDRDSWPDHHVDGRHVDARIWWRGSGVA